MRNRRRAEQSKAKRRNAKEQSKAEQSRAGDEEGKQARRGEAASKLHEPSGQEGKQEVPLMTPSAGREPPHPERKAGKCWDWLWVASLTSLVAPCLSARGAKRQRDRKPNCRMRCFLPHGCCADLVPHVVNRRVEHREEPAIAAFVVTVQQIRRHTSRLSRQCHSAHDASSKTYSGR